MFQVEKTQLPENVPKDSTRSNLPAVSMVPHSTVIGFTPPTEYVPWLAKIHQLTEAQILDLRKALLTKFFNHHTERARVEELRVNLNNRVNQARILGANIRKMQADIQQRSNYVILLQASGDGGAETAYRETELERAKLHGLLEQLRSLKEQVEYFETLAKEATNIMQVQFDQWWGQVIASNH